MGIQVGFEGVVLATTDHSGALKGYKPLSCREAATVSHQIGTQDPSVQGCRALILAFMMKTWSVTPTCPIPENGSPSTPLLTPALGVTCSFSLLFPSNSTLQWVAGVLT